MNDDHMMKLNSCGSHKITPQRLASRSLTDRELVHTIRTDCTDRTNCWHTLPIKQRFTQPPTALTNRDGP